jgi:hypothetical protein
MSRWLLLIFSLALASGCDCSGSPTTGRCRTTADCRGGERCVDGMCVLGMDAGRDDEDSGPGGDMDAFQIDAYECVPCGAECCTERQVCVGGAQCAPDHGPCTSTDDCTGDDYCEPTLLRCIPWGVPPDVDRDPSCTRLAPPGLFAPTVQCEFTSAPDGDPFPAHLHVLSTPMVVDFGIGRGPDAPRRPSIVAVFDDGVDGSSEQPTGVIRILDGRTCAQQAELGSLQLVSHSSPPAVGDLDGDGRAEIVAYKAGGGLVAFRYDEATSAWTVMWRSTLADGMTPYNPTGGGWAGPSIYDLDDDGVPEVLRDAIVFDAMGRVIDNSSAGMLAYSQGTFPVVANVDDDPEAELIAGHGVWYWDRTARRWLREAWGTTGQPQGQIALADFGDYPGGRGWPASAPEVAVITSGRARVQTLDGVVVFGPVALTGGGTGGPPTIADFDGDGLPEFASAGADSYDVFDLDCTPTPRPGGECATGTTTGVLWSSRVQDRSSNVTGSSVFDFEGDGRAEVVYGDECFVRVYDGRTGTVLFSQSRSSCTWYENPVIADLDGDFNAEIVIGDNFNCPSPGFPTGRDCSGFGLGPRNTYPLFAGLRCAEPSDCLSGVCEAGFCRCTTDEQCCMGAGCASAAFVCETPPPGTPGSGNTCRASRPFGTRGIRVFRDVADRWVRSRMIWNQHAYHVTNVGDEGRIPRLSAAMLNWTTPGLNNFRQNVQGAPVPGAAPDITSRADALVCDSGGAATIRATVCNRGTDIVGTGVAVGFYAGDPAAGGLLICEARTTRDLPPGGCENVECDWTGPPTEDPGVDVWVVADHDAETFECRESNNITIYRGVRCGVLF